MKTTGIQPSPGESHLPHVAVLHGPNLNLLGIREPEVYGSTTLEEINGRLIGQGRSMGVGVTTFQSNHEGELIDFLHGVRTTHGGVIINPAGLSHTSVALRDALTAIGLPVVEVHLSNTAAREEFRHRSLITPIAIGVIMGLGPVGYEFALEVFADRFGLVPSDDDD